MRRHLFIVVALCLAAPGGACPAPQAPRLTPLSRSLVEGPSRSVCFIPGSRDFVLGAGAGIVVLRAGDSLEELSSLPLGGRPYEIAVKGRVAYVAAFGSGLEVIDLTDLKNPRTVFSFHAPRATRCAVSDVSAASRGVLYLADDEKLYVFDVSRPDAPVQTDEKSLPLPVHLAAEGNILCELSDRGFGISSVRDGKLQVKTTSLGMPDQSQPFNLKKGVLRNGVLAVLSTQGEVWCFYEPSSSRRAYDMGRLDVKNVTDVALDSTGGWCVTARREVVPFSIVRPASSETGTRPHAIVGRPIGGLGRGRLPSIGESGGAALQSEEISAFAVSADRFVIAEPFGGPSAYSYDARRGEARGLGRFETSGFALGITASRDLLYLANSLDGIRIGRVGPGGTVEWIGHLPLEEARAIALEGTTLYVANGMSGLVVADVSDPRRPRVIGRAPDALSEIPEILRGNQPSYFLCAISVRDGKAYCAAGFGGVEIFNVAHRKHPRLFWRESFSEVRGIDADGRYLYFADGYKGLRIYSLGGSRPSPVAQLVTGAWNDDCAVSGDVAYLGNGGSGVMIADIADRAHPKALGSIRLGAVVRKVFVLGKTLFVANEFGGVAALDVSSPRSPSIVAKAPTVDDARGVFAGGAYVYCADGEGGVYVFKYER